MPKEKFEDQMKRLEEIVNLLENDNVDLDKSIELYEEGLKISKNLSKQLESFEKKLETIDLEKEKENEL